jgi:PAS domain S-box-containing protein
MYVYLLPDIKLLQRLIQWSKYLSRIVFAIALLALLGWQFNIDLFKRPLPGLTAMNPATALGLMLAATALLLLTSRQAGRQKSTTGYLLSCIVISIGLARLADIHIDAILFPHKLAADIVAGISNRMAPNSAVGLVFTGAGLLFIRTTSPARRMLSNVIALLVALLALLSIIGYIYKVEAFHGIFNYVPMAIHTAVCYLFISLAILFVYPGEGLMKEFTSTYVGSIAGRIMIPLVIVIPVILGWLRLYGHHKGILSIGLGVTLLVMSIIVIFLFLVWYNAVLLNKRDALRNKAEKDTAHMARLLNATSDAVFSVDPNFILKSWNNAAERQYGYSSEEVIGRPATDILRTQISDATRMALRKKIREQGFWRGELVHLAKNGDPVTALISVSVTRDEKGEIDGFVNICRDISERKKLEEQLLRFNEELEEQVRAKTSELTGIFERITDAFIALDKNFRYTYLNKKAGELIHRDPQALIGKYVWEVFPDAVDSATYRAFTKAMIEQTYTVNEDYYPPLDLWQENHIYPSPEGLSIFIRNISERKKTETMLRYSEETRQLIMNAALDAIICIDKSGHVIAWNPQAEKIFGWSFDEVNGKPLVDTIIPPIYREQHIEGMRYYAATGHGPVLNKAIEISALNRAGIEFPIELSIVPIQQGAEEFFCAFIRDITRRKKNDEALKASEKKYKLLFESNPIPIWMRSLDDHHIIDVNEAACKAFGYTREEFLHLSSTAFRHPDEVEKFINEFTDDFPMASDRGVWKHKRKDGTYLDVEIMVQDIIYNNQKVRLILANDVTEKIQASEKLKDSYQEIRQLASRLQEIREEERAAMAREVHDELGQQVTGLKMDVSWISKRMTTESEPVRQKIKGILDLLDVTVKTVRKIATELRPSILDDLGLTEAMQWQSIEFEKRSGIRTQFTSELSSINIPGDIAIALFRIYQESLTNVARHANATLVKSGFWQTDDELILEIVDNGKGFDMSKREQKKTLGLLGMKERTQMIGGKYEITSYPGKGTTVLVSIPWK